MMTRTTTWRMWTTPTHIHSRHRPLAGVTPGAFTMRRHGDLQGIPLHHRNRRGAVPRTRQTPPQRRRAPHRSRNVPRRPLRTRHLRPTRANRVRGALPRMRPAHHRHRKPRQTDPPPHRRRVPPPTRHPPHHTPHGRPSRHQSRLRRTTSPPPPPPLQTLRNHLHRQRPTLRHLQTEPATPRAETNTTARAHTRRTDRAPRIGRHRQPGRPDPRPPDHRRPLPRHRPNPRTIHLVDQQPPPQTRPQTPTTATVARRRN